MCVSVVGAIFSMVVVVFACRWHCSRWLPKQMGSVLCFCCFFFEQIASSQSLSPVQYSSIISDEYHSQWCCIVRSPSRWSVININVSLSLFFFHFQLYLVCYQPAQAFYRVLSSVQLVVSVPLWLYDHWTQYNQMDYNYTSIKHHLPAN